MITKRLSLKVTLTSSITYNLDTTLIRANEQVRPQGRRLLTTRGSIPLSPISPK